MVKNWTIESIVNDLQTGRVDVVCHDGDAKVEVKVKSGAAILTEPEWLKRSSGSGAVILTSHGSMVLEIVGHGSGMARVYLRGIDIRDAGATRLPVLARFTSCRINGHEALSGAITVDHDHPHLCSFCFVDEEHVELQIETGAPIYAEKDIRKLLGDAYIGIADHEKEKVLQKIELRERLVQNGRQHDYNTMQKPPVGREWNCWRLMDEQPLTVDMVCSLGGDCIAASQLKQHGLRRYSLPIDWCYNRGDRSFSALAREIENGFSGFALKENMRPIKNNDCGYEDIATGYCFIHHFKASIDNGGVYEAFREVLDRRIKRFYSEIERSEKICFLFSRVEAIELAGLNSILSSCEKRWPGKQFYILGVSYNSAPSEFVDFGKIRIWRVARDRTYYDLHGMPFEWSFLDRVYLRKDAKTSCEVRDGKRSVAK